VHVHRSGGGSAAGDAAAGAWRAEPAISRCSPVLCMLPCVAPCMPCLLASESISLACLGFASPAASCLQPIVCQEADGSIQAHRLTDGEHTSGSAAAGLRSGGAEAASTPPSCPPSTAPCMHWLFPMLIPASCMPACHSPHAAVCPEPTPTNLVQLLAAGIYLHLTGNPDRAIAILSAVFSGVWPTPRRMQRQLALNQSVPSRDCGGSGRGGSSSGAQAGVSSSSSKCTTEGAEAASAASPNNSSNGSPQQAEEEVEEGAHTQLASDLAAALERHCPGISRQTFTRRRCSCASSSVAGRWRRRRRRGPARRPPCQACRRLCAPCCWTASSCWLWTLPGCTRMCGRRSCCCMRFGRWIGSGRRRCFRRG
jgi:hypothetical protein